LDETEAELDGEVGQVAIAVATKHLEDRLVTCAVGGVGALAGVVPGERHGASCASEWEALMKNEHHPHTTIALNVPRRRKRIEGLATRGNADGGLQRDLETKLLDLEGGVGQFLQSVNIVERWKE